MDEQHRKGRRGPDEQGLARGRQHGLAPLVGVPEVDAAVVQIAVERGVGLEEGVEAGEAGHGDVGALQADPFVVREQHALQVPDRLAAFEAGLGGERVRAGEPVEGDEGTAGRAALAPYALGVAGERQRLRQLGSRDDRAAPLPAQLALQHQLAQRLAHGLAGDAVLLGQVALGGDGGALPQVGHEVVDPRLHRVVLRHAAVLGDAGADGGAGGLVVRVVHGRDRRRRRAPAPPRPLSGACAV